MKEIVINNIKDIPCNLYSPEGELIGVVSTELELNDIRLQIKKHELVGYYLIFKDEKIIINSNGKIKKWIEGFFDTCMNQLSELI